LQTSPVTAENIEINVTTPILALPWGPRTTKNNADNNDHNDNE